jgi:membrane-bound lytic murein transglycosylase D
VQLLYKYIIIALFLLTGSIILNAQERQFQRSSLDSTLLIQKDDPIAAMLDSLAYIKLFTPGRFAGEVRGINLSGMSLDSVPIVDAKVISDRIAKLDAISPFKMVYNAEVKAYIDMYANRKRNLVSRMMGLSYLYFPMFEELLAKHKMPLELKYLAIVESALNPNARSKAGAVGLWQFMYGTGKMFNLQVNSYIDERSDPYKATEAACLYLKYLYSIYKDWSLALAAYNSGPGNVNKAIRRSGGKTNYWDLRPYMPRETAGYVPAFIAASYVMHYAKEHNIQPTMPKNTFFDVDTLQIRQKVTFVQLAAVLDMTIEELRFLNPSYILNVIPETDKYHILTLPKEKIATFINNENLLYTYKAPAAVVDSLTAINVAIETERKTHVVKSGETITSIARNYRVSVADLKRWNNLNTTTLKKGQRLVINSQQAKAQSTPASSEKSPVTPTEPKKEVAKETSIHIVKAGDTLWKIATKHGMTVNELTELNNISKSASIKVGQRLKVKAN